MNMMSRPPLSKSAPPPRSDAGVRGDDHVAIRPRAPAAAPRPAIETRRGPEAPKRASTPDSRADDLMQVIRQLGDLLTKENLALKRHRVEEVKAMTERKEILARTYQQQLNAFHRDPEMAKSIERTKREQLIQAAAKLSTAMAENANLLKVNITVVEKFLKTVVDAVKERQQARSAAYSKQGAIAAYGLSKRQMAVSYNQTS